jgi:hypothetical protein
MIRVLLTCAVLGQMVPASLQAQSRIIQDIPCKASPHAENELPVRVEENIYFVVWNLSAVCNLGPSDMV